MPATRPWHRRLLFLFAASISLLIPTATSQPVETLLHGSAFQVGVGNKGAILSGPDGGLQNIDGWVFKLPPDVSEWVGYRFEDSNGVTWGVAEGNEPDYRHRTAVRPVSFDASRSRARSVTQIGPLQITTDFWFHESPDALMVATTLENIGSERLRGVFYTREWRVEPGAGLTFPDEYPILGEAPRDVSRTVWMQDDLLPGKKAEILFSFEATSSKSVAKALAVVDVPLAYWSDATFPLGLPIGCTNGVSFSDYDQDGFIDLFAAWSGNLWRNTGTGSWQLALDIDTLIAPAYRYGASFGDYDNDGYPDFATEPRTLLNPASCMALFKNLGGGANFINVAGFPAIVDVQPCMVDAETNCWGDVDGDGFLDLFVPCYPPWSLVGGPGNFFFHNLGPTGPQGAYHFKEKSATAGLDNPPLTARPEAAQFADVDRDGDIDLYSNGTLYQNRSTPGNPLFVALPETGSGVLYSNVLEEGAAFFDYDMDGDLDLFTVYESPLGVQLFENRGDGTFFAAESGIIDASLFGIALGLSAVDWDNDGDIDLQTRQIFRRNQLVETGQRKFTFATHNIDQAHIGSATPAWGDFDHDGDLDAAIGNWTLDGHFYENVLYDGTTPLADRRYVRVKPLRDSATVARGLEVEYGARVQLRVHGDPPERQRVQFTASSSGYLTQNEYAVSFGLPPDPFPANPALDLRFDITVRFPSAAENGAATVGPRENPLLGNIDLATLVDREIRVYRSGRVVLGNCDLTPTTPPLPHKAFPTLVSAHGGTPIPPLLMAPTISRSVGIEFDTLQAVADTRISQVIVDGQFDPGTLCSSAPMNLSLWDVTQAGLPTLIEESVHDVAIEPRNDRHTVDVDWLVPPGRVFRTCAFMNKLRPSQFTGPAQQGPITVRGGLNYLEVAPCLGVSLASSSVDANHVYTALRYKEEATPWIDLGRAKNGSLGAPLLTGSGDLAPNSQINLTLTNTPPNSLIAMTFGQRSACLPFIGGTLVPNPDLLLVGPTTDGTGKLMVSFPVPSNLPPGLNIFVQHIVSDAGAPGGVSLSNAIAIFTPD